MINIGLHSVFPTSILEFDLSNEFNEDQIQQLKDLEKVSQAHDLIRDGISTYAVYQNLVTEEGFEWLGDTLYKCIQEYEKLLNLHKLEISNCWTNFTSNGAKVMPHRHEGSVCSGALYIQGADDSAELVFHSPIKQCRMYDLFVSENEFNTYYHYVKPKPYTLYIFPSWLEHETKMETSNATRQVVSFNTIYG
jgi:uncharacterized protein (TIGR02466 family)